MKKIIKSEQEYDDALLRIQTFIRAQVVEGTAEFLELGLLLDAVEEYEKAHYPILESALLPAHR